VEIRILGAHMSEAQGARLTSLLIDESTILDAGGVTASLSLGEQKKIKTVLLTHQHFDHTRDLVTLTANTGFFWQGQLMVRALAHTLDILTDYLLDGKMYLNFLEYPSKENPTLILEPVEPYSSESVDGYSVLPLPVRHSVPAIGYQVSSSDGKSLFYTGDTTAGLADCWQHISPQLLITEVAGPNRYEERLRQAGHMCARLLKEELVQFRQLKGYLPRVLVIHIGNPFERDIKEEVAQVARDLDADISLGYEDMTITL